MLPRDQPRCPSPSQRSAPVRVGGEIINARAWSSGETTAQRSLYTRKPSRSARLTKEQSQKLPGGKVPNSWQSTDPEVAEVVGDRQSRQPRGLGSHLAYRNVDAVVAIGQTAGREHSKSTGRANGADLAGCLLRQRHIRVSRITTVILKVDYGGSRNRSGQIGKIARLRPVR